MKKLLSLAFLLALSLLLIHPMASAFPSNPFAGVPFPPLGVCDELAAELVSCLATADSDLSAALSACSALPQGSQQQTQCRNAAFSAYQQAQFQCDQAYASGIQQTSCPFIDPGF